MPADFGSLSLFRVKAKESMISISKRNFVFSPDWRISMEEDRVEIEWADFGWEDCLIFSHDSFLKRPSSKNLLAKSTWRAPTLLSFFRLSVLGNNSKFASSFPSSGARL